MGGIPTEYNAAKISACMKHRALLRSEQLEICWCSLFSSPSNIGKYVATGDSTVSYIFVKKDLAFLDGCWAVWSSQPVLESRTLNEGLQYGLFQLSWLKGQNDSGKYQK